MKQGLGAQAKKNFRPIEKSVKVYLQLWYQKILTYI
jgi:hypothetical protein